MVTVIELLLYKKYSPYFEFVTLTTCLKLFHETLLRLYCMSCIKLCKYYSWCFTLFLSLRVFFIQFTNRFSGQNLALNNYSFDN